MVDQILCFLSASWAQIIFLYDDKLRVGIFTGFLTLSGLLFTIRSFTITNIYRDLYGNPDYQQHLSDLNSELPERSRRTLTGSLRLLSRKLLITLLICFATSIFQVTFGLFVDSKHGNIYANNIIAALAIALVFASIVAVALAISRYTEVVREWFAEIDRRFTASENRFKVARQKQIEDSVAVNKTNPA